MGGEEGRGSEEGGGGEEQAGRSSSAKAQPPAHNQVAPAAAEAQLAAGPGCLHTTHARQAPSGQASVHACALQLTGVKGQEANQAGNLLRLAIAACSTAG